LDARKGDEAVRLSGSAELTVEALTVEAAPERWCGEKP
jgi:hypothetical protein